MLNYQTIVKVLYDNGIEKVYESEPQSKEKLDEIGFTVEEYRNTVEQLSNDINTMYKEGSNGCVNFDIFGEKILINVQKTSSITVRFVEFQD